MGPICETCGSINSASNRYCGQCGRRLEAKSKEPPEEYWHQPEFDRDSNGEPAAHFPPEVIDYDNHVPIIAPEGTDRRHYAPPDIAEQVRQDLEREEEQHNRIHHAGEEPHRHHNEFLRWDITDQIGDKEDDNAGVSNATIALPRQNPFREENRREEQQTPYREERPRERTGVSGPSFLGLTDDVHSPLEEELEPKSHYVRNGLLAVLAGLLILAAFQWRSIRDYGLAYVQNGTMTVVKRDKNTPRNPPAVAADNTSRDLGLSPAPAKAGSPQPVESSPNADRPLPVQQAASTPPTKSESPDPSRNEVTNSAPPSSQPTAMSSPIPDVPKESTPAPSAASAKPRAVATAKPNGGKARAARETSVAVPGADEMSRASRASDDEARAAWLWKAVGKGNPQAPLQLAQMYERGTGVVRSCDQAQVLLRSAAGKGNEEARMRLQQIRLHGCR